MTWDFLGYVEGIQRWVKNDQVINSSFYSKRRFQVISECTEEALIFIESRNLRCLDHFPSASVDVISLPTAVVPFLSQSRVRFQILYTTE